MAVLDHQKTIDLDLTGEQDDPRLGTDFLFGPARGKMFGVLICHDREGREVSLRAYSGQYNGLWQVPGWAPPLFDLPIFNRLNQTGEPRVKAFTRQLECSQPGSPEYTALFKQRKTLSRSLMQDLHRLYRLHNFRGQSASLHEAWSGTNGIPTGSGDCCAPKLLNQAARLDLRPNSIAEFYWGLKNPSASRAQGRFYPSCHNKCAPILGFLLCGLEDNPTP